MQKTDSAGAPAPQRQEHGNTVQLGIEPTAAARRLAEGNAKFAVLSGEAKAATDAEHAMSVAQAIKRYPKAVIWSIIFSTAIAMEGYDKSLIGSFFAFPPYAQKYGKPFGDGYQVPAQWQASLSNGARAGEIVGLLLNGIITEKIGFKKTMIGALTLLTGLIFIPFFAQNIETLLAGDILMGIPWGVFQTLTPAYAAEVCPVVLRPYLTTYVNMNWGIGQLISAGVLRALLKRNDQWAYRIPFALQWMWPVPLIIAIAFAPESPWWLVRKGRNDDAKTALRALTSSISEDELDQTVSMMRHTDEVEREMEKEISAGTSYFDCFKGVNLRRTEITIIIWVIQAACDASLISYAAYFFQQAGLSTNTSFDFSIAVYATAIAGVFISWFAMTYFGRRTIYIAGLSGIFLTMLSIGFSSLANNTASSFAIGSLLLVFTLCYDISVGTVAYSIVAEMPASRLRTKTIALARTLYNCQGIINGVITPFMLNPGEWNWRGRTGFFWAGTTFLCLLWSFFRLPEPKDRTYAELDFLFEQKVPARKFKSTVADPFQLHAVGEPSMDEKEES